MQKLPDVLGKDDSQWSKVLSAGNGVTQQCSSILLVILLVVLQIERKAYAHDLQFDFFS